MLHVINELTIDTCDIHQIEENAEVKSNRWLSIQTICSSTLVHKINSTHDVIANPSKPKIWSCNPFLSSGLTICHSFFQGQMIKQHWPIIYPFASHCITWKKLAISPCHFWNSLSVGSSCSNTINVFLE